MVRLDALDRATVDPHGYRSVGGELESEPRQPDRRPIAAALAVGLMYYGGAKIGWR
jgi:hypothetical protein